MKLTVDGFKQMLANKFGVSVRSDECSPGPQSKVVWFSLWKEHVQVGSMTALFSLSEQGEFTGVNPVGRSAIFFTDNRKGLALQEVFDEANALCEG